MNWNDIRPGTIVYHRILTHWGKGKVIKISFVDCYEAMFERGSRRIVIDFEGLETPARLKLSAIRKTPNKKKIREMVAFYQGRGVDARDGGDRLLIPTRS